MSEENSAKHTDNVYANTYKGDVIHISQAESGRKGYFCLGCKREMQAKKGEILIHHFAHDPKDVQNKGKCTYSDETYRHKLAKEILQRIKKVKVPAVYKYPPIGMEGKPNKISDAKVIYAEVVKNELTFYENEDGDISFGRNIICDESNGRFLLIKPDVAFFDADENPILLIEIVVTNKIDEDKLSKIKKLGIDTIQITIPKDSPEEIEKTFFKTNRTKWVYNYEQEQVTYVPTSYGSDETVLPIDEFQRKLLEAEESYECKAAQINNLIRTINKCLDSEQFRAFVKYIGAELHRVEENTERNRVRLRELQAKHKRNIEEEFRLEEDAFVEDERRFREGEREFAEKVRDYEARYNLKRESLERAQREFEPDCQQEIERVERNFEELGASSISIRERREEIERESRLSEQLYRERIGRVGKDKKDEMEQLSEIERRREGLQGEYLKIENTVRRDSEQRIDEAKRQFAEAEPRIREEFENHRRESIEAVERRDSNGVSRIRGGLGDVLKTRERLRNIREGKDYLKRLRKYKDAFDTNAYKSWPKL